MRKDILLIRLTVIPILLSITLLVSACLNYKDSPEPSPATQKTTKKTDSELNRQQLTTQSVPPSLGITTPHVQSPNVFADVAERAVKSVVNISSVKVIRSQSGTIRSPFLEDPFFRHFFGPHSFQRMPKEKREKSLGSGVIVNAEGIVLTNNHVVEQAEKITISLSEDEQEYEAELIGTDPKSDIAVLKIKGDTSNFAPLSFGNSDHVRLGEMVLAVGNPFGLSHTVTLGIVSAKGRANVGIVDYEDFIQTDAAINPGNSGGALVNMKGELVGINTAILSRSGGYQGIGFSIPANMAKSIMESLLKHGKVIRGWLGISIQDVDDRLANALELSDSKGVLIADVIANSPAQQAGLQRGDVVVRINGKAVDSSAKLRNMIAVLGKGTKADVEFRRKGDTKTIAVTLGEIPDQSIGMASLAPNKGALGGLTVAELNPINRRMYHIPNRLQTGVVISDVIPGSPAHSSGLKAGDVLLELNKTTIQSVDSFTRQYNKSSGNLLLLVFRDGHTMYLVFQK